MGGSRGAPEGGPGAGRPVRVVVVDDEPEARLLLKYVLAGDGRFAVVGEAGDGAEALRVTAREQPDAVVLDLMMPGVSGLEALPRLKELAPVVVVSAYDEREAATARGARAFLDKDRARTALCDVIIDLTERPAGGDPRVRPGAATTGTGPEVAGPG